MSIPYLWNTDELLFSKMFIERKDRADAELAHRLKAGTIDQAQLAAIGGKQRHNRLMHARYQGQPHDNTQAVPPQFVHDIAADRSTCVF